MQLADGGAQLVDEGEVLAALEGGCVHREPQSGVARPCRVSSESMMVAWPSASKSVQSMATLMQARDPTT